MKSREELDKWNNVADAADLNSSTPFRILLGSHYEALDQIEQLQAQLNGTAPAVTISDIRETLYEGSTMSVIGCDHIAKLLLNRYELRKLRFDERDRRIRALKQELRTLGVDL